MNQHGDTDADLARLHHDLAGPVAVFGGFLDELRDAVESLARADVPVPIEVIDRLLDEDFRPCLACLDDALEGLRGVIAQLAVSPDVGGTAMAVASTGDDAGDDAADDVDARDAA